MLNPAIPIIASGYINQANDALPGMVVAPQGTGQSPYAGQLGSIVGFSDTNVRGNPSVGTVYGGLYQYVQLASGAAANPAVGSILFFDATAAPNLYRVTTSESGSTDAAVLPAGIVLSSTWTAGYYSWIQVVGLVYVKFRGTLTSVGAVGSAVYAAAAGGADLGLADVLSSANPTEFSDVALMQRRYIGPAFEAPTNGGLTRVYVNFKSLNQ